MIAVVDYHKGNLKSVERGLVAAGAEVLVTKKASKARRARTTKPRPTTPAAWQCCRAW